jgi:FSR family fosmidomycin resistance protein-like MFS transporter
MTGIAATLGWRSAALAAALLAALALLLLFWCRRSLADPPGSEQTNPAGGQDQAGMVTSPFAFLQSGAVWMCFAFFLLITTAFGAIQNFATPILQQLHGLSLATAATALSAYLVGGAGGILSGGFLARQKGEHERLIAAALGTAALLVVALATLPLPQWAVLPLMVRHRLLHGHRRTFAGPAGAPRRHLALRTGGLRARLRLRLFRPRRRAGAGAAGLRRFMDGGRFAPRC